MKRKDIPQLRTKTIRELKELIRKAQEELLKLKINARAGKLKNVRLLSQKRHDLARLETVIKEKELYEKV